MKRFLTVFTLFFTVFTLFSCNGASTLPTDGIEITDDLGSRVTVTDSDLFAACHASFADCLLLSGGSLVGATSDARDEHGLDIGDARIIGTAKQIDTEALVASGATVALLSADLASHLELKDSLNALGIKCIYFKVDTFDDYASVMKRLCAISGRDDLYEQNVTLVRERIEKIRESIPQNEKRTVLLMRAYSSGIKAKSDDNLAGLILKEFGLKNVADEHSSLLEDMSLEHIVKTDPDCIFVLTMGNEEAARAYLRDNLESNAAFSSLSAVKNQSYHILPKELFHYKPNEKWDKSYEHLAKILYPEVFN